MFAQGARTASQIGKASGSTKSLLQISFERGFAKAKDDDQVRAQTSTIPKEFHADFVEIRAKPSSASGNTRSNTHGTPTPHGKPSIMKRAEFCFMEKIWHSADAGVPWGLPTAPVGVARWIANTLFLSTQSVSPARGNKASAGRYLI
eukprot:GEMP01082890.1.p1 GENE.GEMP01082890.1~~GEMP01082890.1.p1  ORF type:complete len:147 (+),score=32.82 GEMP01082890.1:45-485(+)